MSTRVHRLRLRPFTNFNVVSQEFSIYGYGEHNADILGQEDRQVDNDELRARRARVVGHIVRHAKFTFVGMKMTELTRNIL